MYNVIIISCATIKGDYTCFTNNSATFEMLIVSWWYFRIEIMIELLHEFNTFYLNTYDSFNASTHCMSKICPY